MRCWRRCLILEASLDGGSGLDVCRRVKSDRQAGRIPILMTSSVREQVLVKRGLREGADDFLSKPCHPTELLWRVRGLLRRYEAPVAAREVLKLGPMGIDSEQGIAILAGKELVLTKKELLLLEVFLRDPGRVMTRRFLETYGATTALPPGRRPLRVPLRRSSAPAGDAAFPPLGSATA